MSTYEFTMIWLAGVQLLISVLGFVVVAWTLRVLVRQIVGQSSAGVATRQLEWRRYIRDHVEKSPVLRRYVIANPAWFAHEFVQSCGEAGASSESQASTSGRS